MSSKDRKFVYKPFPENFDCIKINSNIQKRNLIALKIKRDSQGLIQEAKMVGVVEEYHAFRELFDLNAESKFENHLKKCLKKASIEFNLKNIDIAANILKNDALTEPEIDWDSFSIPPYKFLHYSLPLCSKDIRSTLKVILFICI